MIITIEIAHPSLYDQFIIGVPTLLGVVLGGCITSLTSWLTNRAALARSREQFIFERKEANSRDLRCKGEELYVLIQHWMNGLSSNYLTFNGVMQGKLSYNQAMDLIISSGEKLSQVFNPARMEVLIDVYFPSCRVAYDKMLALRADLNRVHSQFVHSHERGESRDAEFLHPYVEAQKGLEREFSKLQKELIQRIRAID